MKQKPITKDKKGYYIHSCGCWNCDFMDNIYVKNGINVTQHLMEIKPTCRRCGCVSLKKADEFKTHKKIMKDIMLHHAIEHMEQAEGIPKSFDHYQ